MSIKWLGLDDENVVHADFGASRHLRSHLT
jgi:hypothetical protein